MLNASRNTVWRTDSSQEGSNEKTPGHLAEKFILIQLFMQRKVTPSSKVLRWPIKYTRVHIHGTLLHEHHISNVYLFIVAI